MLRSPSAALACAFALYAGAACAQQVSQQPRDNGAGSLTLRVQSRLVSLDVVVTDDTGKPVPGLTQNDFTVFENNIPQTIRNFDSWQNRPAVPEHPTVDAYGRADWGNTPLAMLVLDNISTTFENAGYAAAMLKRYLRAEPKELPVPTSLMMVDDHGYKTLCTFTRDRDALITALEKRPPVLPERLGRGDQDAILVQTFLTLQQIALAEAGLEQHKSIIWVGAGFTGLDPTDLSDSSSAALTKAIRDTVNLLTDSHATVYKIDPTPTTTSTAPTVDVEASLDAGSGDADAVAAPQDPLKDNFNFNNFAVATGGQYFYGLNDLDRYFRRVIEQTDEYYTLAYVPPAKSSDQPAEFRSIRVTVNRPGLHVTTRQGYYSNLAPDPPPTSKQLGLSLIQIATGDMNFTGVGVRLVSVQPASTDHTASVTFQLEDRSLAWTAGSNGLLLADATAVLVALDAKHEILSSAAYRLKPYLKPQDAAARNTGALTVRDELTLPAKTAYMRLIVRDSSGRIGTLNLDAATVQDVLTHQVKR